jgi:hypothetical protein
MVLVESIREILKSDENVTPADIAKKLDLHIRSGHRYPQGAS